MSLKINSPYPSPGIPNPAAGKLPVFGQKPPQETIKIRDILNAYKSHLEKDGMFDKVCLWLDGLIGKHQLDRAKTIRIARQLGFILPDSRTLHSIALKRQYKNNRKIYIKSNNNPESKKKQVLGRIKFYQKKQLQELMKNPFFAEMMTKKKTSRQ